MLPEKEKGSDPAVAWHGLQRFLNHPNSGNRRLLALASVTGLEVLAMRIPYRWVGGWGPRYLACKRERGPVRVPSSLTEDLYPRPLMSSFGNHERTWLRHTP